MGRPPLELRQTAPAAGGNLPVILLSHGYGPSKYIKSKDGYAPLAQFWAERGFAVIQPTHASSRVGGLPSNREGAPFFWRERVRELTIILDRLYEIEEQTGVGSGRLDRKRIAAAGHSLGGHTVSLLLGATLQGEDFSDSRISAGILLAAPGRGGEDLTDDCATRFPFFDVDFSAMTNKALVVCGDQDDPHFTPRGPEWHADAFYDATRADRDLLTLHGVGHGLGGIAGLDAKETETEAPDVLEALKRLTLAWLRTALGVDPEAWKASCAVLERYASTLGGVTSSSAD